MCWKACSAEVSSQYQQPVSHSSEVWSTSSKVSSSSQHVKQHYSHPTALSATRWGKMSGQHSSFSSICDLWPKQFLVAELGASLVLPTQLLLHFPATLYQCLLPSVALQRIGGAHPWSKMRYSVHLSLVTPENSLGAAVAIWIVTAEKPLYPHYLHCFIRNLNHKDLNVQNELDVMRRTWSI